MKPIRAFFVVLLVLPALFACDLEPATSDEGWSTVTVSLFGTAYSDLDVTAQTDTEGTQSYTVLLGSLPWRYYQFSFRTDYSIQVAAASVLSTNGSTTADSTSFDTGSQTVYTVTDAGASFSAQAARGDVILNDDDPGGSSAKVYGVASNQTLYVYGDESGQNIFDPGSFPAPVNYSVYRSHELWLWASVTDSEGNETDTTYHQQDYVIDMTATD